MINWISVEDDLPPKGVELLCYMQEHEENKLWSRIIEGKFHPSRGWESRGGATITVLYWADYNKPAIPQTVEQSQDAS